MMNKINTDAMRSHDFFKNFAAGFRRNTVLIVILAAAFVILAAGSFLDVRSVETGTSLMNDYEVGQVADRTIITERALTAGGEGGRIIPAGTKIIRKGFVISEEDYANLALLADSRHFVDYREVWAHLLFIGAILLLALMLLSKGTLKTKLNDKQVLFLGICFILVYFFCRIVGQFGLFAQPFARPVLIPSTLAIMLTAVLVGQNVSLAFTLLLSLGVLCASGFSLVPALFVLFSGYTGSFIIRKVEKRIDLVFVSLILAGMNVVIMLLLGFVFPDSFAAPLVILTGVAFNGFLSGILALGFLTPLESLMNTATLFRLMDLSDLNSPVMKRLLLSASGTYNHSMMVATLAENACREIGANPLLARVGAYYHDLGKMEQPEYFVENQRDGNKHDELNPRLSAAVIRRHVKNGVEKARQLHLPKEVIDIIAEHHGNSLISYFYNEAKKQDDQTTPEEFSYPGTPPSSKESAVVMLADTVEAACRTLDKPSVPRLEKFIHDLIMTKYEHGQLDMSDLTFRDLQTIQTSFVKILAGYYHSRIEYPNQKDPDQNDEQGKSSVTPRSAAKAASAGQGQQAGARRKWPKKTESSGGENE